MSFGYYAMEPDSAQGKMYVEHYAYKSETGDVPKMMLTRFDGYIYDAFYNQLQALWRDSQKWDCKIPD
jgi:hypothetical protein